METNCILLCGDVVDYHNASDQTSLFCGQHRIAISTNCVVTFVKSFGVCSLMPSEGGWTRRLAWALVILHFIHGGEASNPGPSNRWTLGTFNPSGLNGKQQLISEHLGFGDIWAISETHLSSRAFQSFKRGLFTAESEFTYCVGGHHAPPRPRSDHVGAWTGVAMPSKHPTRAIPVVWPPDVYQSSRVQVTATLCNNLWITGGVVWRATWAVAPRSKGKYGNPYICCL